MSKKWRGDVIGDVGDDFVGNSGERGMESVVVDDIQIIRDVFCVTCYEKFLKQASETCINFNGSDMRSTFQEFSRERADAWADFDDVIMRLNVCGLDDVLEYVFSNEKMLSIIFIQLYAVLFTEITDFLFEKHCLKPSMGMIFTQAYTVDREANCLVFDAFLGLHSCVFWSNRHTCMVVPRCCSRS